MKKPVTAIITAAIILASFTACTSNSEPDGGVSNNLSAISDDLVNSGNFHNNENSEAADPDPQKPELSENAKKLLSEIDVKSFTGPDGETVQAADAADIFDTRTEYVRDGSTGFKFDAAVKSDKYEFDENGAMIDPERTFTVLRYDFAYLRYCRPLFYRGEMPDKETEQKMISELPEDKWFKVKAGDKLDCGLTVKKALYERFPVDTKDAMRDNYIEFDGELALEGVLTYSKNDRAYASSMGDLSFIPDPTKTSGIPDCTIGMDTDDSVSRFMFSADNFLLFDGSGGWAVGTVDDIDKDYIFGDDDLVRVKVTLKNLVYNGKISTDFPLFYAEIVDIERVEE